MLLLFFFQVLYCHIVALVDQVKGYINEMAMRLEDEDERISNIANFSFMNYLRKVISGAKLLSLYG